MRWSTEVLLLADDGSMTATDGPRAGLAPRLAAPPPAQAPPMPLT
jgi:hypothetical protein